MAATVALLIVGLCCVEENPLGPVQLKLFTLVPFALSVRVLLLQIIAAVTAEADKPAMALFTKTESVAVDVPHALPAVTVYVTYEPEIYTPLWRSSPTDGAKQGSSGPIEDMDTCIKLRQEYDGVAKECLDLYNKLLADGVAPEQARSILPQGTYTEFVWTGSLYAFARVYNLRIDAHAQWEIQEYAKAIDKLIAPLFPVSWQTLTTK